MQEKIVVELMVMETAGSDVKSEAIGWSRFRGKKEIFGGYCPCHVVDATGTGWRLLGPPTPASDGNSNWYFERIGVEQ